LLASDRLALGLLALGLLPLHLLALGLLAAGCAAPPPERLLAPDPARTGGLGEDGPFGVELELRRFRVRVDQVVDTDVFFPLEADGSRARGRRVAVVLHGGLVGRHRYRWLGRHLASRGLLVLAPGHALDLAFFEQGNAADVLHAARAAARRESDGLFGTMAEGPAAIFGHSLGGVVAAGTWDAARNDAGADFTHLGLFASYPASSTAAPHDASRARVLSLIGSVDGRVSVDQARAGAETIATSGAPVTFAIVEGMNHMQFADDVTAAEAANDGTATIGTAEARARALVLVDALVEDLETGASETLEQPTAWPAGVRDGSAP
jgi:dienelactone hydrolase